MRYCVHCGKKISDKALFCKYCGERLDFIDDGNEKSETVVVSRTDEHSPIDNNSDSNSGHSTSKEDEDSFPKFLKIAIMVSLVLVIAVLGIGAFLYLGGPNKEATTSDTVSSSKQDDQNDIKEGTSSESQSGHRYQVVNEPLSWKNAKIACEQAGGHLATITTKDEYYEIVNLIEEDGVQKYHYWLGATDEDDEAAGWKWVTGEKVDHGFKCWDTDKPNDSHKTDKEHGEDYMEMKTTKSENHPESYMKWNDVCDSGVAVGYEGSPNFYSQEYYGYICEWEN